MKQIKIGTCVPAKLVKTHAPPLVEMGFESIALNFHMTCDVQNFADYAKEIMALLESTGTGATVSSIGYYCNALMYEEHQRTLERFIDAAPLFGTRIVSTFAGALEGESVPAAMPKFKEVFGELGKRAQDNGVKIAIENCPMGGDWQRATCNIGFNPAAWEMMFNEVPCEALGLEWEPSHQMTQLIEPLAQLKKWMGKVHHVHGKDATIDWDQVRTYGVSGAKQCVSSRTPGFGQTDWREIIYILSQNGYDADICVEGFHDSVYGGEREIIGQRHALHYLKWCRGGEALATPWKS